MNEDDYKNLISTYQRKSMDLFTQLVVAETKVEMLDAQLREAKLYIQKLENGVEDPQEEGNYEQSSLNKFNITRYITRYSRYIPP